MPSLIILFMSELSSDEKLRKCNAITNTWPLAVDTLTKSVRVHHMLHAGADSKSLCVNQNEYLSMVEDNPYVVKA